jgi:hypothetical protein
MLAGPEVTDVNDPPHFSVSAEVFGRVMHTLKREYIDKDDNRRISTELNVQLISNTTQVAEAMTDARKVIPE